MYTLVVKSRNDYVFSRAARYVLKNSELGGHVDIYLSSCHYANYLANQVCHIIYNILY